MDQSNVLMLQFGVRFYIPNHCLWGRCTRHFYYEQLKRNVLNYGLLCHVDVYLQLAGLAIQADHGVTKAENRDYDETNLCLSDYFPLWVNKLVLNDFTFC